MAPETVDDGDELDKMSTRQLRREERRSLFGIFLKIVRSRGFGIFLEFVVIVLIGWEI